MRKGNIVFLIILLTGVLLGIFLMIFNNDLFVQIVGEGM